MRHPEPDELVGHALPGSVPDPEIDAHLADCAHCRAEVDALRHTVDLAREGNPDAAPGPPPGVWDRVVDELGPELSGPSAAPSPALRSADAPARGRPVRRRRWVAVVAVAAALAIGLAGGIAIGAAGRPATGAVAGSALPALAAGSGVSGAAGLSEDGGVRTLTVSVDGARVSSGEYLEAWLMDGDATRLYSLGGLPAAGPDRFSATFALPDDLPLDVLGTVDVSAERFDGDPGHSGDSLVRGPAR